MTTGPANFFQLFNAQHADFALGANSHRLSSTERMLWQNIELYSKLIKEAGLDEQLQAAHAEALRTYAETENGRQLSYKDVARF